MNKPRKRFGQNFLTDRNVIDRIVKEINPQTSDYIVEIGPGRGALTQLLVRSACHLQLIEIDRDLVSILKEQFAGWDIPIHSRDVLKFDFNELNAEHDSPQNFRVVGNLPYNISTPLLFKLFGYASLFSDLTFMLQLEVVNRITAEANSKNYGRLTIMTDYFCESEKLFEVPPGAFTPQPKVTSAIIRLIPRSVREVEVSDVDLLGRLLIMAFSKRRKTIRNALGTYVTAGELEELGIDPRLRPENIEPGAYFRCANYLSSRQEK